MKYYLGREATLRRSIEQTALSVFAGWSYEQIVTPAVDYYALFELGMGEEAERAFRFTDSDGRLLALRPELTSTIARAVATLFSKRPRPLRLCYAAPVFRQQPPSHTEWRREVTQVGCELIGRNSQAADLEVLLVASEFLRNLDLSGTFVITLNDLEIFNGIAADLNLYSKLRHELRELIDLRNAADLETFLAPFDPHGRVREFTQLLQLSGKREIFEKARRVITNPRSTLALANLESLWITIEELGLYEYFDVDLADISRLDYYTGLTFKIYVEGVGVRIGGGGRYDSLIGNFGMAEPAVGFVVEVDPLAELLRNDRHLTQEDKVEIVEVGTRDLSAVFGDAMESRVRGKQIVINFSEETTCLS